MVNMFGHWPQAVDTGYCGCSECNAPTVPGLGDVLDDRQAQFVIDAVALRDGTNKKREIYMISAEEAFDAIGEIDETGGIENVSGEWFGELFDKLHDHHWNGGE